MDFPGWKLEVVGNNRVNKSLKCNAKYELGSKYFSFGSSFSLFLGSSPIYGLHFHCIRISL